MTVTLAKLLMALAARSLGPERRAWAEAMAAELEAASAEGRALAFALGCLLATWRVLPDRPMGRLMIGAHLLALGLIVPAAALSFWAAMYGYPYLGVGRVGVAGFLAGSSERLPLLNAGDWAAAPAMTALVLVLGGGHLVLAWHVVDRDWSRAIATGLFNAAALTTMTIVSGVLFLGSAHLLAPVLVAITEALAVLALAHGHESASSDLAPERDG